MIDPCFDVSCVECPIPSCGCGAPVPASDAYAAPAAVTNNESGFVPISGTDDSSFVAVPIDSCCLCPLYLCAICPLDTA